MGIKAPELKSYRPNEYDGFDFVHIANVVLAENLRAAARGNRWPHGRIWVPEQYRKPPDQYPYHIPNYYSPNVLAKCVLNAVYHAALIPGLEIEPEAKRRMDAGTAAHIELHKEYRRFSFAAESLVFDFKHRIWGYIDEIMRNFITAELAVIDYKNRSEFAFRKIKRSGTPEHLKITKFYPALPDDTVQVMLYIHMLRGLIRDITDSPENIECVTAYMFQRLQKYGVPRGEILTLAEGIFAEMVFGWKLNKGIIITQNQSDTNQRKESLVEYDERVVEHVHRSLAIAERYVDDGTLVDWSQTPGCIRPVAVPEDLADRLPPEDAYAHSICPYRDKCLVGIRAMQRKGPRRDYPLYVIMKLKRQKREAPEPTPVPEGPQLSLISETPTPKAT